MIGNYGGDFDNRLKQRQKQKAEVEALLENESTTLGEIFSMEDQEKQELVLNQFHFGSMKAVKL